MGSEKYSRHINFGNSITVQDLLYSAHEGDIILFRNTQIIPSSIPVVYEEYIRNSLGIGFSHSSMVVGKYLMPSFPMKSDVLYCLDSTTNRFSIPDIFGDVANGIRIRRLSSVVSIYQRNGGKVFWIPISRTNSTVISQNRELFKTFVRNVYGSKFRSSFSFIADLISDQIYPMSEPRKISKVRSFVNLNQFESVCSQMIYVSCVILGILCPSSYFSTDLGFNISTMTPAQLLAEIAAHEKDVSLIPVVPKSCLN